MSAIVAQKAATVKILSRDRFRLGLGAGENLNEHVVGMRVEMLDKAGGRGKPKVGQVAIAYDPDRDAAIERAHEQFRWFGLGWKVNADLPNPDSFEGATQFVTREQVADALSCGPDVDARGCKTQQTSPPTTQSTT